MKRSSFFKTLATLIISPKILGEINFDKVAASNIVAASTVGTGSLITDLQLLTPRYYKQYLEKYGNEEYSLFLEHFIKNGHN